jgi:hypothetical protein
MPKPSLASVTADNGNLRRGPAGKILDKDGYPIISRGYLTGSEISPNNWGHVYTYKFKVDITSTNGKRNWKGRLVAPVFDHDGNFVKWEFVVVLAKNDADAGEETDSVSVTVTNPDGQSDPLRTTVTSGEIP